MAKKLQILVIEDDEALLRFLADYIEELGHEAHIAFDKLDAETILKERRIDAIIMDVFIRKEHSAKLENTLGILAAIRYRLKSDLDLDRNLPVLVISGGIEIDGGYSPLRMARDLGGVDTLKKPFSEQDIKEWIDSVAAVTADP